MVAAGLFCERITNPTLNFPVIAMIARRSSSGGAASADEMLARRISALQRCITPQNPLLAACAKWTAAYVWTAVAERSGDTALDSACADR